MVANCNVLYQNLKISHKDDETCLRQRGLPGYFYIIVTTYHTAVSGQVAMVHLEPNISKTAGDRDSVSKDHQ